MNKKKTEKECLLNMAEVINIMRPLLLCDIRKCLQKFIICKAVVVTEYSNLLIERAPLSKAPGAGRARLEACTLFNRGDIYRSGSQCTCICMHSERPAPEASFRAGAGFEIHAFHVQLAGRRTKRTLRMGDGEVHDEAGKENRGERKRERGRDRERKRKSWTN